MIKKERITFPCGCYSFVRKNGQLHNSPCRWDCEMLKENMIVSHESPYHVLKRMALIEMAKKSEVQL